MSKALPAQPKPPDKPLPGDCCGGGCAVCVNDAYEEALADYERRLALWHAGVAAAIAKEPDARPARGG